MKRLFTIVLALMLCASAYAQDYVYLSERTPVRTGPGTGYSLAAQLSAGSTVGYLQQSAYDSRCVLWYRISLGNGESGWVPATFATLTEESGFASFDSGFGYSFLLSGEVIASGNVNIRSGAGLHHPILGTMPDGETAVYLGASSMDDRGVVWYHVQFGSVTGWVSSLYAQLVGDPELASFIEGVGGDSNIRKGPGLGYASIGTLFEGESAPYLGLSSVDERGVVWYCIRFGDQTGWVSSRYTQAN